MKNPYHALHASSSGFYVHRDTVYIFLGLICATLNDASLARRVKYSKFSMCREIYTKIVRLTCRSDGSDGRRRRFTYHVTPDRGAPPRPRALRGCGRTAHFPAHRRPCAGRARPHPGSPPVRGTIHDCAAAARSAARTACEQTFGYWTCTNL